MRRILKRRPSPSMVVAFIALLVAMGGTGYAAATLPKNSVGSKQLKTNAVVSKKIKNGAVTSDKVKNGSLTGSDIKLSSLGAVPTAAAIDRAILRTAAGTTSGPTAAATASCDAGYRPVGGGARVDDIVNGFLVDSYPEVGGWTGRVATAGPPSNFTVFAICVPINQVN
jgi:hypothetical protein